MKINKVIINYSSPGKSFGGCGIAYIKSEKNGHEILVGTMTGDILVFSSQKKYELKEVITKVGHSIADLSSDTSNPSMWVSATQRGDLTLWKERDVQFTWDNQL